MLGDPITELTIAMEIDYFQLNRAEYFVPVVIKIPGRELALARKGGAERTVIDFIGEIKDDYGTPSETCATRWTSRSAADRGQAGETAHRIRHRLYAAPRYLHIKLLARDDETGRIGTYKPRSSSEPEQGSTSAFPSVPWC